MKPYVYIFSILEPINSNEEFANKVTPGVFDTLFSIFSLKRWLLCVAINEFAKKGYFQTTGRYRIETAGIFKTKAKLIRIK